LPVVDRRRHITVSAIALSVGVSGTHIANPLRHGAGAVSWARRCENHPTLSVFCDYSETQNVVNVKSEKQQSTSPKKQRSNRVILLQYLELLEKWNVKSDE
jgi:hypothetical protein